MGITNLISAIAAAMLLTSSSAAQFGVFRNLGHAPQAQTQDEFDSYLAIMAEPKAAERARLTKQFLSKHPDTELRATAYEYQLLACQELNDFECMLQAGEKILPLLPENLTTLVTLALAIPNATSGRKDGVTLLARAENYARRALDVIERKQIPRQISYREWKQYRSSLEAQAHEALGHVAMKRSMPEDAITEFELAVRLEPSPVGRTYFRLGVALAMAGRTTSAMDALIKASELGPELIRQLAVQELGKIAPENDKQ
jgi:tetratricopeptide (TPR) repeat protein